MLHFFVYFVSMVAPLVLPVLLFPWREHKAGEWALDLEPNPKIKVWLFCYLTLWSLTNQSISLSLSFICFNRRRSNTVSAQCTPKFVLRKPFIVLYQCRKLFLVLKKSWAGLTTLNLWNSQSATPTDWQAWLQKPELLTILVYEWEVKVRNMLLKKHFSVQKWHSERKELMTAFLGFFQEHIFLCQIIFQLSLKCNWSARKA